jgi:NADPH:quinone reductase-like Zn-dependent oxidoreductase
MHAIEVEHTGGPEVLSLVEKPHPSPGPGEVLIKAEAIGVNFVDTYFRAGLRRVFLAHKPTVRGDRYRHHHGDRWWPLPAEGCGPGP